MSPRRLLIAGLAVLALAVAGCGSDDNSKSSDLLSLGVVDDRAAGHPAGGDRQEAGRQVTRRQAAQPTWSSRTSSRAPGRAAVPGATATVQYVGVLFKGGKQFDASWDRGQPFSFKLGAGMVIPGWDRGLVGMKVGGRRELIIPADQAYGDQSPSPDIPPNSALIFVIDLTGLQ